MPSALMRSVSSSVDKGNKQDYRNEYLKRSNKFQKRDKRGVGDDIEDYEKKIENK